MLILPSNPTTGFRWELRNPAANGLLQAPWARRSTATPKKTAGLVGSGGESTWRFRVTAAGEDKLELAYRRPWEAEVAPAQTFVCPIAVK